MCGRQPERVDLGTFSPFLRRFQQGKPPTRCAPGSPLLPERRRGAEESERDSRLRTDAEPHAALPGSAPDMQSLISPVTKAILVALFIFAILLILYVILWYICRDVDCDHGI
ncbi:hypothetical protein FQA47_000968 [Xyrichtys novacula]|uniref:Uncharacterized protein n=1 Tax=Xyrichtys novacula TaxID=13765 RepID=A0AAV1H1H8_XYRNO|nr:hypothetical protein FQA47_000968 [Xyrichtys novacula]